MGLLREYARVPLRFLNRVRTRGLLHGPTFLFLQMFGFNFIVVSIFFFTAYGTSVYFWVLLAGNAAFHFGQPDSRSKEAGLFLLGMLQFAVLVSLLSSLIPVSALATFGLASFALAIFFFPRTEAQDAEKRAKQAEYLLYALWIALLIAVLAFLFFIGHAVYAELRIWLNDFLAYISNEQRMHEFTAYAERLHRDLSGCLRYGRFGPDYFEFDKDFVACVNKYWNLKEMGKHGFRFIDGYNKWKSVNTSIFVLPNPGGHRIDL